MQLKDVAPSYGIAMLVAISVYFLKYIPLSYWIVLPLQIVIGIVVIVIVCLLLKPSEFIYLKDIVKEKIRKDR